MNRVPTRVGPLAAAIAALLTAIAPFPARAQEDEREFAPVLTVSGTGESPIPADQAEITFGVTTAAPAAPEALAANTARCEKVASALRELGLAKDEVRTRQFTIFPEYGQQNGVVTGYRVSNILTVKTRKIDMAGAIVQRAVDAGANEFHGVSFTAGDERTQRGRDEAITVATQRARHDAEVLARAAGARLVRVRRVTADSAGSPPPRPMYRMGMAVPASVAAPEFTPGDVQITASVTIEYEIEPAK